jgi:monovalent cation/hydrogen antiporter
MHNIGIIILLLAIITVLAQFTNKIKIPYPILLVFAGIGVGLVPGLPAVSLNPDVIFLIFLPPVLFAAAWTTSWPDFKAAARPITLLATGCVLFTTTMVAAVAHYCIPTFGWPESFVLGAIISPPDAVAAAAATKGLGLPKRVVTILEGESLVNDATGLIAYRYAIATAASGSFILWLAGINFFYVAGLGTLLGLGVGILFFLILKYTPDNAMTDTTLTFLAPYAAYLVAEEFHTSGVLAVVAAGLFLSQRSSEVLNHETRLQANFVWQTVIFLLNGIIFILIGLQLPLILNDIKGFSLSELLLYGFLVSLATIIGRIIWTFPATFIPRWLSKRIRTNEPRPSLSLVSVVAWSGMRGVVSLAAAMALPLMVTDGVPFPHRDLIIFLTFSVIFSTLVFQGLTLPSLIKWFKIKPDTSGFAKEQEARLKIASSIIEHIEENYSLALSENVLNQIKTKYEIRIQRVRKDQSNPNLSEKQIDDFNRIRKELLAKERDIILSMRKHGEIGDEILRRIEHELDLEESRLVLDLE